jgi:pimeloyl-ACP methyl ester carboxylesterase
MRGTGDPQPHRDLAGPLVVLPESAAVGALAERVEVRGSPDGLERFALLAHGAAAQAALDLSLARPDAVRALVLAAPAPLANPALAQRLTALKVPALAVFGTRDAEVPPATGRLWRALVPGCHVVFLYDAGHDLAADQPRAFADVVLDFIGDPAAFLVNRRDGSVRYA